MAELVESGNTLPGKPAAGRGRSWLKRLIAIVLGIQIALYLGIGLGYGMASEAAGHIVSVAGILVYFALILVSPYTGLLFWLVLYPFTETRLNIPLGGSIPDLSPTRLVIGFLAIMLIAEVAIRKRPLPRLSGLDFWGLVFIAGISLSTVATPNPVASIKAVLDQFLVPLVFYYLAKYLVTNRRDIERLFDALLMIGGYTAFLAIHEQLTGVAWLLPADAGISFYASGIRVLRSLWGTNAIFGSIFALVIPIAFYRMLETRNALGRLGYAALNLIFLISMFFTYKRAAWISMLISLGLLFVLYPRIRRVLIVLVIVCAVPTAVLWNKLVASSQLEQRLTDRVATLNGRTTRWDAALQLWEQKPIFGQGLGNFDQYSGFVAIENQYLHILVSGGLVAFIPYLMFWLLVLRDSLKLYIRGPSLPGAFASRPLMAVYLAALSTYLVKGLSGIHSTPINLIFYVLVGAVVGAQFEAVRRHNLIARQLPAGGAPSPASPASWEPTA